MKTFFLAIFLATALVAGLAGPAAAASWGYPGFYPEAQGQKGRPGPERGEPPRDFRKDRRDERRERMNDDERQALHRDLDKANRELYRRRAQK